MFRFRICGNLLLNILCYFLVAAATAAAFSNSDQQRKQQYESKFCGSHELVSPSAPCLVRFLAVTRIQSLDPDRRLRIGACFTKHPPPRHCCLPRKQRKRCAPALELSQLPVGKEKKIGVLRTVTRANLAGKASNHRQIPSDSPGCLPSTMFSRRGIRLVQDSENGSLPAWLGDHISKTALQALLQSFPAIAVANHNIWSLQYF